jgi:hypothetical protein
MERRGRRRRSCTAQESAEERHVVGGALMVELRPNVWHQRRAKRVRCMPGLDGAGASAGP